MLLISVVINISSIVGSTFNHLRGNKQAVSLPQQAAHKRLVFSRLRDTQREDGRSQVKIK